MRLDGILARECDVVQRRRDHCAPSDGPDPGAIVARRATDVRRRSTPRGITGTCRRAASDIAQVLVSEASPTRPRAPHGAAPCRGVYHHLAGLRPDDRTDRDALRGRLQRALPRGVRRRARLRVPRLEHPLRGRRPPLHPRARARRHRRRRPLAARNRRRRERRAARELRRRVAHGRLPVASGRAEPASHSVGRAPRRRPRPPAGRRARGAVRAPRPTRRPHRMARSRGHRRDRSAVARPVARHVRSRERSSLLSRSSSSATAPPSTRATSGSPTGSSRNTSGWWRAADRSACSRCSARGPIPAFSTSRLDPSPRRLGCYVGDATTANYMGQGLADVCTLRSWLSMWSLSTSQCRARPHLARIRNPALVVEATDDRGCYPSDAAQIFDDLASTDKEQCGAHRRPLLAPSRRCARPGGRPDRRVARGAQVVNPKEGRRGGVRRSRVLAVGGARR